MGFLLKFVRELTNVFAKICLKAECTVFQCRFVMNKCFLLNPEKKLAQIRFIVFEQNAKNAPLIPKNVVTEPKIRRLGYSNNQMKSW